MLNFIKKCQRTKKEPKKLPCIIVKKSISYPLVVVELLDVDVDMLTLFIIIIIYLYIKKVLNRVSTLRN